MVLVKIAIRCLAEDISARLELEGFIPEDEWTLFSIKDSDEDNKLKQINLQDLHAGKVKTEYFRSSVYSAVSIIPGSNLVNLNIDDTVYTFQTDDKDLLQVESYLGEHADKDRYRLTLDTLDTCFCLSLHNCELRRNQTGYLLESKPDDTFNHLTTTLVVGPPKVNEVEAKIASEASIIPEVSGLFITSPIHENIGIPDEEPVTGAVNYYSEVTTDADPITRMSDREIAEDSYLKLDAIREAITQLDLKLEPESLPIEGVLEETEEARKRAIFSRTLQGIFILGASILIIVIGPEVEKLPWVPLWIVSVLHKIRTDGIYDILIIDGIALLWGVSGRVRLGGLKLW